MFCSPEPKWFKVYILYSEKTGKLTIPLSSMVIISSHKFYGYRISQYMYTGWTK